MTSRDTTVREATDCGLLLADKGPGVTSFQVVAHVRRVLRVPKVGHGGTLDPMATGVLPLLLGPATRLAPYLLTRDKEYEAVVRLGISTDTLDATGRVTTERPVPPLDGPALGAALAHFEGEIDQVPPMFSALHVGGRRLHELARAGLEVPRAPRRVRIDAIELLEWATPLLTLRVACGTGTYIRSLAADLGKALGCGARLEALRRTRLGAFRLADAMSWEEIIRADPPGLRARVRPAEDAVAHLDRVDLDLGSAHRLASGQRLSHPGSALAGPCRLYVGAMFLGIGEIGPAGLRALRILHANLPRPDAVPG